MGLQLDIGDNDSDQSDFVPVQINPGDTVTVANITGSAATLNYLTALNGPSTPITVGSSQAFTTGPLWLQSQGRSTVKITGGVYGN
jgi:hypothetical protein